MFGFGRKKIDEKSAVALFMSSFFCDDAIYLDAHDLIARIKDFSPRLKTIDLSDEEKQRFSKHHVHIKFQFLCGALAKTHDIEIYLSIRNQLISDINNLRNINLNEDDCNMYNQAYSRRDSVTEIMSLFCKNTELEDMYPLGIELLKGNFIRHFVGLNDAIKTMKII